MVQIQKGDRSSRDHPARLGAPRPEFRRRTSLDHCHGGTPPIGWGWQWLTMALDVCWAFDGWYSKYLTLTLYVHLMIYLSTSIYLSTYLPFHRLYIQWSPIVSSVWAMGNPSVASRNPKFHGLAGKNYFGKASNWWQWCFIDFRRLAPQRYWESPAMLWGNSGTCAFVYLGQANIVNDGTLTSMNIIRYKEYKGCTEHDINHWHQLMLVVACFVCSVPMGLPYIYPILFYSSPVKRFYIISNHNIITHICMLIMPRS